MLLNLILERFAKRAPMSVMVRAALEYALAPEALDALFRDTAELQHEKTLLFSSVVDLMGLVVARVQPSLNAAYQAVQSSDLDGAKARRAAGMLRRTTARTSACRA